MTTDIDADPEIISEHPDFITALGQMVLSSLPDDPTPEDIAEDIVVVVEEYHNIIEENQGEIIENIDSEQLDYEQTSTNIITNTMLEMVVSMIVLDIVDYICDELGDEYTTDDVYDELPEKYIQAKTTR